MFKKFESSVYQQESSIYRNFHEIKNESTTCITYFQIFTNRSCHL